MENKSGERCPRCGGQSIELVVIYDKTVAKHYVVIGAICVLFMAFLVKSTYKYDPDAPVWLRFAPLAVIGAPFAVILRHAIQVHTGRREEVCFVKCRDCSYEWDIYQEEHSPSHFDTTQEQ